MKKNWFFIISLAIAALLLAGTAAWFSVFGLTQLFYAAGLGITILAASLEFGKIVTVSYVYRFWKNIEKGLRGFYIFAVVFIMFLTSMGIYGFLTSAYQKSANKIEVRDSQIKIMQNKKTLFVNQLDRVNKSIESSTQRINTISGLRNQQEKRLDNLYNQKYISVAKRTESQIIGSDEQIKLLNTDITEKMKQTNSINDSIAFYDQRIIELNSSEVSNEVGSYKFIADLTGVPMNKVVNFVALLIILVFDPLAIALLIGVNKLTMLDKKKEEEVEIVNEQDEKEKKKSFFDKVKSKFSKKPKEEIKEEPEEIKEEKIKEEPELTIDKKPPQEQIPLQLDFTETPQNEEINEEETVSEKKTLFGDDLQENFIENKDYEEELAPLDIDNLYVGQIVSHDVFGRGKILDVYPNKKAKIDFFNLGIKELNTEFANLKEIRKKSSKNDDLKKNEFSELYVREKTFDDGKTVFELTKNNEEFEEEIPFIEIKVDEPETFIDVIEEKIVEPVVEFVEEKIVEPVVEFVEEILEPEPVVEEPVVEPPPVEPKRIQKPTEGNFLGVTQDNEIQSVTFGNKIVVIEPSEGIRSQRIRFTKDRKGRV